METIADTTGAVLVEETPECDMIVAAESDLGSGAGAQFHTIVGSSETMADTTGAVLVEETEEVWCGGGMVKKTGKGSVKSSCVIYSLVLQPTFVSGSVLFIVIDKCIVFSTYCNKLLCFI